MHLIRAFPVMLALAGFAIVESHSCLSQAQAQPAISQSVPMPPMPVMPPPAAGPGIVRTILAAQQSLGSTMAAMVVLLGTLVPIFSLLGSVVSPATPAGVFIHLCALNIGYALAGLKEMRGDSGLTMLGHH